jgi:protein subunit release factor A
MAKKEDLTAELHRLESEIEALGTAVSDSQIWHKKARIEQIKKELAELESPAGKFNAGTDKVKEMMAVQQPQLTPEQIAELRGGRG